MFKIPYPSKANGFLGEHAELMLQSYRRLLGMPLIVASANEDCLAEILFKARFALVSHTADTEPMFYYANQTALSLFEFSWDTFTSTPSRLSAEPVNQMERERLLAEVTGKGFIKNYEGIRISKTGKRFRIKNAVVWNLVDSGNIYQGQAACFREWDYL